MVIYSGGSRISHWEGANLRRVHFLAKMHAKMKEMDPVGWGARRRRPLDPPMVIERDKPHSDLSCCKWPL